MMSAVFALDMSGFLENSESWTQWTLLPEPLLQLVAQRAEFGHAGFDQFEFVLQQLRDGAVRIGRLPDCSDAVADLAEGKTQSLSGLDVLHQLHHVWRIVSIPIGAALRSDQSALLVKA